MSYGHKPHKVIDDIVQSSDKIFACSQFIVDSLFPDHEKLGVEVLYNNIRIPELGSTERVFLRLLAPCELAFSLKLLLEKEPKTS